MPRRVSLFFFFFTMAKYDVIVIGAGLGGLECAYMLAKHGKSVLVLEQGALLGGCLQSFRRNGLLLDTGFHYVGGLDEGQMLHRLFGYFNLLDLPWRKMDSEFFDEVVIQGDSYAFANGYDNFARVMSDRFPHQKDNIAAYVNLLRQVGDNISHSFDPRSAADVYQQSLFARSAFDFLHETISDPRLIDVLSGTSLKMELSRNLPLYIFAQINSSFIQSAYRLQGGGMQIAESLRTSIESMGGTVLRNSRVTAFEGQEGRASAVIVNGDRRFEADVFISDAHPAPTVNLLQQAGLVRKIYHKRISGLANTFGVITVNIALKPQALRYLNRNVYIYSQPDVWSLHSDLTHGVRSLLVSFTPPPDGDIFARNVDLITPLNWDDVSHWFGTKVGHRGDDYLDFKQKVAQHCISLAESRFPGLSDAIDAFWVSSPLTYSDYTATACGSAYGIRKDFANPMLTILTPKTPVANVFLTGQNLNLHGILGTSMTAMFTCAELIGMPAVVDDLSHFS